MYTLDVRMTTGLNVFSEAWEGLHMLRIVTYPKPDLAKIALCKSPLLILIYYKTYCSI